MNTIQVDAMSARDNDTLWSSSTSGTSTPSSQPKVSPLDDDGYDMCYSQDVVEVDTDYRATVPRRREQLDSFKLLMEGYRNTPELGTEDLDHAD